MAGGQLVPHVLPNGQTIMIPGYLAPKSPALAMPSIQAPSTGPDQRLASNVPDFRPRFVGPGIDSTPSSPNILSGTVPSMNIRKDFSGGLGGPSSRRRDETTKGGDGIPRVRLGDPNESPLTAADEKKPEFRLPTEAEEKEQTRARRAKSEAVDPSTVVIGKQSQQSEQPQGEGSKFNPGAQMVLDDNKNRSGGGGPRRSPGLEVGSIKEERQPGQELLPQQMRAMGLMPYEQELDPDQPFVADDPQFRNKLDPLEQSAKKSADLARKEYELQVDQAHKQSVAEREQLAGQSDLIDQQLGAIAERRTKIAKLQETAEQRAQEASSMQPRTREQVWGSKGNVARGLAILSAVLGGLAGNNNGWNMIDKSINEAVDDDRYEAERRAKLGLAAKSDYEHALTLYGDPQMAALDAKNRKLANMAAMAKSQAADPGLDPMAKERAISVYNTAYNNHLEGVRKLAEGIQGKVLSQEVNYKQAPATGGGAPKTRAQLLHEMAQGAKDFDTATGADNKPKLNPTEQASLNEEEADMAPMKSMLDKYKGVDVIPGVQPKGALKRGARGLIDWAGGEGTAAGALDSDEERANRMVVERAALAYRHKMTGAGGNIKELAGIDEAFAGARTRADLERAVRTAEQSIAERRRLSGGGASTARAPTETPSTFRPE